MKKDIPEKSYKRKAKKYQPVDYIKLIKKIIFMFKMDQNIILIL